MMKLTDARDTNGRFIKGNVGGPGNPHGGRVAQLRNVLIHGTSIEDMKRIWACILAKAKDTDDREQMKAAELVFERVLGKPIEADLLQRIEELEGMLADAVDRLASVRALA